MTRKVAGMILLAAAAALPAADVAAGTSGSAARRAYVQAPLKDCTRLNGRWGYYGNPWCTPAEQLRWDRWDARRR